MIFKHFVQLQKREVVIIHHHLPYPIKYCEYSLVFNPAVLLFLKLAFLPLYTYFHFCVSWGNKMSIKLDCILTTKKNLNSSGLSFGVREGYTNRRDFATFERYFQCIIWH